MHFKPIQEFLKVITQEIDKGTPVNGNLYLDFSKAFDKVHPPRKIIAEN